MPRPPAGAPSGTYDSRTVRLPPRLFGKLRTRCKKTSRARTPLLFGKNGSGPLRATGVCLIGFLCFQDSAILLGVLQKTARSDGLLAKALKNDRRTAQQLS